MTSELSPNSKNKRSFSLSIGKLTFGSFMLVLAVIVITSTANVIAIRHIDLTFSEVQRLQSVGDLAEDIDRRMNELRLTARDFVTDPGAGVQFRQLGESFNALGEILKKTRVELAPEQRSMIDGVTERLTTYRNGIERISALIDRRAQLIAALPPLRGQFEAAAAATTDHAITSSLFDVQSQITLGLLARNPSAAEQAAQGMRSLTIADAPLRSAVENYAEAIIAIASREREIADIDTEVVRAEGRLIGRVTDLLREVSARRGRVLSRDFARTLARTRWQSIVLGTIGVLIGIWASLLVVRRTVRPLGAIASSIRALAAGDKKASIPSTDIDNEIGDIARAAEIFRRTSMEVDKSREAAETALRNLRDTQASLIEAEKLAALGRLVAGVAHEVNNPVGISLTVASALERKTATFAAEVEHGSLRRSTLNDYLKTSRDASAQLVANLNRAAELIQSFKQVAADRNYSDQRTFDLGDLTEQVVLSLRPGLRKHNLTLNVDCQPNLIMNSYPGPYGQVLTNLFLNAVAHAFPDNRAGTIEIKGRESDNDNVEVMFSDDGCGMSLDVRRRAFDPFFTTRRDQGGTGLGLHIVYSIVTNRLGGRLELDSEAGGGTRIRMILPRTAPLEQVAG